MRNPARTTTGGCPYGIESPPRESRRPANGAQECAPYGRNARRTITERGGHVFVGAVREPPVLKGRQSKLWIPAFAGMTGFRGGARRRENPRCRLDVAPRRIEGTPGLAFRRHSGEGRNPEPGRAAANGRSRSIHARVHGFVGAAREPPVLTAWADNPAIVRLVGGAGRSRTTPTECSRIGGMGTRRGQPQGVVPTGLNRRRVNRADPRTGRKNAPPTGEMRGGQSRNAGFMFP